LNIRPYIYHIVVTREPRDRSPIPPKFWSYITYVGASVVVLMRHNNNVLSPRLPFWCSVWYGQHHVTCFVTKSCTFLAVDQKQIIVFKGVAHYPTLLIILCHVLLWGFSRFAFSRLQRSSIYFWVSLYK